MVVSLHSEPPSLRPSPEDATSKARATPRGSVIPFSGSLLPTGSPFGWNARDRSLYVQFLTALLMVIVTFSFAVLDGWPFLLGRPDDDAALRTTTMLAVSALVFWIGFYVWTWRWYVRPEVKFSWLLFGTIAAHVVTATAVCYAIGPYTAASGCAAPGDGAARAALAVDRRDRLVLLDGCDALCEQGWSSAIPFLV
jgi:hypothetical protein